jgi:DNA modification methylase
MGKETRNSGMATMEFDSDLVRDAENAPGTGLAPALVSDHIDIGGHSVRRVVGEFWTAGQRRASSLHEISYRACFKPQLPAYFIRRFTAEGGVVYDPFSGRGTTIIEAALSGRSIIANDANPLSMILARPRLEVPDSDAVAARLQTFDYDPALHPDRDLSMFYEARTASEIAWLRNYLRGRHDSGTEDTIDAWIRMIATNRLTGHSPGFFSVYTFPPNQAVSVKSQIRINQRRGQTPEYRDTKAIILKKTRRLLRNVSGDDIVKLKIAAAAAMFLTGDAGSTGAIPDGHVDLTVTSPPFLDIVQYADDNWLRCWFNDLPLDEITPRITMARTVGAWSAAMQRVFDELFRVTRNGGVVAFEVGEIRNGKVRLEDYIVPLGISSGFHCEAVLINTQQFTKTANIWGVANNQAGTNSNRIAVFRKP